MSFTRCLQSVLIIEIVYVSSVFSYSFNGSRVIHLLFSYPVLDIFPYVYRVL